EYRLPKPVEQAAVKVESEPNVAVSLRVSPAIKDAEVSGPEQLGDAFHERLVFGLPELVIARPGGVIVERIGQLVLKLLRRRDQLVNRAWFQVQQFRLFRF